jgi:hypothetical protein
MNLLSAVCRATGHKNNNNNKIIYLLDVFQSKKPSMESLEKDLKLLSEVSY